MIKRIISLLISLSIVLSLCCAYPVWAQDEKYSNPVIKPIADTYVRGNQSDKNFEHEDRVILDSTTPGSSNHRFALMEFSFEGYEEYVKKAENVYLTLYLYTDAGAEDAGNKFTVIPLEGDYKNIDLTTLTYRDASEVCVDGVSLVNFIPAGATVCQAYKSATVKVDVTDYCKGQSDSKALFMIKSLSGAYSIYSKDSSSAGSEPTLTIESDYTGILNRANEIANSMKSKYSGKRISSDIDFETKSDGYDINFVSSNDAYISGDGNIIRKPLANEDDVQIEFTINITHPENPSVLESESFNVTLLKEGAFAATSVVQDEDTVFEFENISASGRKHILYFDSDNLTDGGEYALYSGSASEANLVSEFTADCTRKLALFDVSSFVSGGEESFTLTGDSGASEWSGTPVVMSVSESAYDALMKLYTIGLGDLKNVTENLNLPHSIGDYNITWSSSDKSVLADSGRVERGDKDTLSTLTAKLSGDDFSFSLAHIVTVIRENTDVENNLYPELKDPMHTSDERLFGKWDEADGSWSIKPLLRYDNFEGLASVEASAKKGDYDGAKSNLLSYFRLKEGNEIYTFEPNTEYDIKVAAMHDKIWTYQDNDKLVGEVEIGTDWGWYSIDMTDYTKNQNGTYWIMESDMDGTCIEIASREHESGNLAFVEIIANGQKNRYPVIADTYISAGDNSNVNCGTETVLISREAAGDATIPFGTNTSRAYLQFGFPADNTSTITSVKLNFYGRATGDKPKKAYCLTTQNSRDFIEEEFVWDDQYPQAFCFKETGFIWRTVSQYNFDWKTEFEWINYSSRLYQPEWLLPRYLVTGNEDYAYRALELAMSQYTQQPGALYPRNLEGGWRAENLIRTMYTAINSEHMTPEIFAAFLKWIYDHGDGLKDQNSTVANWNSAFKVNFARICAFFPEIAEDGWWEKAKDNLYKFYSGTLLNEDGSYTEACSNYIGGVLEELVGALEIIGAREGEDNEYYVYFKKQLANLLTYYTVGIRHSNGNQIPFGDGGRGGTFKAGIKFNEFAEDPVVQWLATDGKEGTAPDYTTRMYPSKAIVAFKSGWHAEDLSAFYNNDSGGSHSHRDDLALDVNAFNSCLLVDAGVSSYSEGSAFSEERYKTINHNTIQVDDIDQVTIGGGNIPGFMELKTNGSFDYLKSDSDNKMYPGIDVNRNVLFLKNKFIIVSDFIIPYDDEPHTYRQAWHPDYNFNMELDPETHTARTNFAASPNIKIVPVDTGESAKLFNRMMMSPSAGETYSRSVQYYKENVTGNQTFDTVLYPDNTGIDTEVRVTRTNLDDVALEDATSFVININDNTGYFYSSNEETFPVRTFGDYTYNGEMVYIENDDEGNTSYIALTKGSDLKLGGESIVEADEEMVDFSAKFESSSLKLYTDSGLPEGGVKLASHKKYKTVYLNDEKVEFEYSDGIISTKGNPADEKSDNESLKPGTPGSSKPNSGSSGGSGGNGIIVPSGPSEPITSESSYPFADSENHWAKDYILSLFEKKVVSGISQTEFAPDRSITRAEFTKILVSACGIESKVNTSVFSDVASDSWYAPYVSAAYESGIISGYDDGTFRPDSLITREEMAKMLCSAADIMKKYNGSNADISFADNYLISDWAYLYVKKACGLGLFNGDNLNRFNPSANATRAETVAVVCRLLDI